MTRLTPIEVEELARRFRMQKIVFETAAQLFDQMQPGWAGSRGGLLAQLVGIVGALPRQSMRFRQRVGGERGFRPSA